jgi:low temperature requirement protein LtrA
MLRTERLAMPSKEAIVSFMKDVPHKRQILADMQPRDPREPHRPATPLELLYDLVFVVAIAQAAIQLHHAIAHGHTLFAAGSYLLVFFAIWWAWMNFTWFASAFDNDDPFYRIMVFIQMTGVLVLAAGVPSAFNDHDLVLFVIGYVIMRVGLVSQWLRAATASPAHRKTALRYGLGVTLCQLGWIGFVFVPIAIRWPMFFFLVAAELIVPMWAETAKATPWHPHHIAERFGLMTIITIGESVLAAAVAVQAVVKQGIPSGQVWITIVAIPVVFFSMWWLYFARPHYELLDSSRKAFIWGYAHFVVFASAAAVGAAFALIVEHLTLHTEISDRHAEFALAIPIAAYLTSLWFVRVRCEPGNQILSSFFLLIAATILFLPAVASLTITILVVSLALVMLVAIQVVYSGQSKLNHSD